MSAGLIQISQPWTHTLVEDTVLALVIEVDALLLAGGLRWLNLAPRCISNRKCGRRPTGLAMFLWLRKSELFVWCDDSKWEARTTSCLLSLVEVGWKRQSQLECPMRAKTLALVDNPKL